MAQAIPRIPLSDHLRFISSRRRREERLVVEVVVEVVDEAVAEVDEVG